MRALKRLLVADEVHTLDPARPRARAVLLDDARIAWVGDDAAEAPGSADETTVLDGIVLQPAFVDAHVHLTATGLALGGLALQDCRSLEDCLAAVRAFAGVVPERIVWGTGWDEDGWPEGRPPSADELSEAAGGRPVLLTRTDGHSSVVDRRSLESGPFAHAEGVERDGGGRPTGLLRLEANHMAWRWFRAELSAEQLHEARVRVARQAAALGVASVHEMNGPDLMGQGDFEAWLDGDWPIEVVGYWAGLDLDFVAAHGLHQVGEVFLDGSVGSRTAAFTDPYADGRGRGHLREDTDELVEFAIEATRRRVQIAFHCIGDRAVGQAVEVLARTAEVVGRLAVRQCRHRLEHCELVPDALVPQLARLGVVASVQPAFDREWGGADGFYARRLGAERGARMNPLRTLAGAGVRLAFGSDANVTPIDPWGGVEAACGLRTPEERLDPDEALRAATQGGRHAARQDHIGVIRVGQRADLAAFALADGQAGRCEATWLRGRRVHEARVGL